jgi:hypothetical protein
MHAPVKFKLSSEFFLNSIQKISINYTDGINLT